MAELLADINIMNLNKNELQVKAKEMQDMLTNILKEQKQKDTILFEKRLEILEVRYVQTCCDMNQLKEENKKLKKKIKRMENELDDCDEKIIDVERRVNDLDQYGRRENFEISGLPDTIPNEELEGKVLELVNAITERGNDKLTSKDIHACHRLKKEKGDKEHKVIVRMVNRHDTSDIKTNRKKLKTKGKDLGYEQGIFINDNLSKESKNILKKAKTLKSDEMIDSCWTYNGTVFIKIDENDKYGYQIHHIADFEEHFSADELGW